MGSSISRLPVGAIIRNDKELDRIRRYIEENPLKWELDPYHPAQYR